MEPQADIALIGLAVMGQNLILNMDDHGFTVVAYNRFARDIDRVAIHQETFIEEFSNILQRNLGGQRAASDSH